MNRKMRRGAVCAMGVMALIGFAGCGDDDESSSSSTAAESSTSSTSSDSLSKTEFVDQANAICAQGNQDIDTAANETFSGGKPSQADIEKFVNDGLLPSVIDQVDQISQLPPPEGDEDQVQQIIDAAEQAIQETQADPAAVTNDQTDPFAKANQLANAYGMTECGG